MIEIMHVSKNISTKSVIKDLTWTIEKNTICGLVGPNGVGKSTLLRLISGVYHADEGEILIDGISVFENDHVKKRIVFVSDDPYYLNHATLESMKTFYQIFYPSFNNHMYHTLLKTFKVSEKEKIHTFSKGMKRQVSLILALSLSPDYLLLDEAFDGLDPVMRLMLKRILTDEILNRDFTVIISSHNLRELEDICDTICMLNDGKITVCGDIDTIKQDIHKFQVGFSEDVDIDVFNAIHPIHIQKRGKIITFVVKGDVDELTVFIEQLSPVLVDTLPISLEEVFVYEMEESGYAKID